MHCLKCRFLIALLLFFQSAGAQTDYSGIDEVVKRYQKQLGKDVVVLVNRGGKNVYSYQSADFNAKMAAPIGDASKWLTAAVVMMLVDEGKIGLDEKVGTYIPIFEQYMKGYITVRQCLTHTHGIQGELPGVLKLAQRSRFENLEEEVKYLVSRREIENNPGEAFNYSQVGLDIAARVVEVVTRKTFDRVATEKLFRPAGMRTATFYSESGMPNPSAGASASAQDMVTFMNMLLNKGMANGKRILSEASVAEMMKAQFPELPVKATLKVTEGMRYGLGCWIQESDDGGTPLIVGSPGPGGVWPWMDLKRGYTGILLPLKESSDIRSVVWEAIRNEIEGQ